MSGVSMHRAMLRSERHAPDHRSGRNKHARDYSAARRAVRKDSLNFVDGFPATP
jgi:hypothetical protein